MAERGTTLIIGLGKTGLSVARHLARRGEPFAVADTRAEPPLLAEFRRQFPSVPVATGELRSELLLRADRLVVSPGVPLATPAIREAMAAGVPLCGDIDLFAREAEAPVVAITGSNGKSTVTTLVGEMARAAGLKPAVGGNLGVPALDLLDAEEAPGLFVLELSSFQLETCMGLETAAACVLNLSPDHMDRYAGVEEYRQAKLRIYRGCAHAVCNGDDPLTEPGVTVPRLTRFRLGLPGDGEYGVVAHEGERWLARGEERLLPVSAMRLRGRHNLANALAALALGEAAGIGRDAMLGALRNFAGLPHRCQWVRTLDGVDYINDSKGTNVGATLAAIEGLAPEVSGRLILILGGDGKGADFAPLAEPLARTARAAVLIGRDAPRIEAAIAGAVAVRHASTLAEAVAAARSLAEPGDLVLLSPACASFDMFRGFEERGTQFMQLVEDL